MANPKYADLPGIASGQPDVYETSDLPESDQGSTEAYEDQSENVEKLSVSATEAFSKFKGQTLDASGVDFTDRIRKTARSGYSVVTSGDYEMLGHGSNEFETPQQRFQRLQHETRELLEDINKLKDVAKDNEAGDGGGNNPTQLLGRMEQLQTQLNELNLKNALGSEMIANLTDPHGALQKKLINEIDGYRPSASSSVSTTDPKKTGAISSPTTTTVSTSPADYITYELHYRPELGQLGAVSKVADLELRLKKLESVLGTDNSKLTLLTGHTHDKSVLGSIQALASKLSLLDPQSLDQIEARLGAVLVYLQQIAEKKPKLEELEKHNRVAELYELVKKTEAMGGVHLQGVVDRLEGLQELHEQALQFGKALAQLDHVQQQIVATLETDKTQLKRVQETFGKNSELIRNNVASLEERIALIKK